MNVSRTLGIGQGARLRTVRQMVTTVALALSTMAWAWGARGAENHGVPVTFRSTVHGTLAGDGDRDTYVFEVPAGASVAVRASVERPRGQRGTLPELRLAVFDPAGELVEEASAPAARLKVKGVDSPGRWAVRVSTASPGTVAYKLKISGHVQRSVRVAGGASNPGEPIEFRVPALPGAELRLSVRVPNGSVANLELVDGEGLDVAAELGLPEAATGRHRSVTVLPKTGVYVLRISCSDDYVLRPRVQVRVPRILARSLTLKQRSTMGPEPTATEVNPPYGPEVGGRSLTIVGGGFVEGSSLAVVIDGIEATDVTRVDAQTITCTSPPGSSSGATVEVFNGDGQNAELTGVFEFIPAPSVDSVTPTRVFAGETQGFQCQGVNFRDGPDFSLSVSIGGLPATAVTVISESEIQGVLPAFGEGVRDVLVVNGDGQQATLTAGVGTFEEVPLASAPQTHVDADGSTYDFQPAVAGTSDDFAWELAEGPGGMIVDGGTGFLTWSPEEGDEGIHTVRLAGRGQTVGTRLTWEVSVGRAVRLATGTVTASGGGTVQVDPTAHPGKAFSISFPGGTLGDDAVVAVDELTYRPGPLPVMDFRVTPGGPFRSRIVSGPDAHVVPGEATVVIPYSTELLEAAGVEPGSEDNALAAYILDEATGEWTLLPTVAVDAVASTVTATTSHLSTFRVELVDDLLQSASWSVLCRGSVATGTIYRWKGGQFRPGERNLLVLHGLGGNETGFHGVRDWALESLPYDNITFYGYPSCEGVVRNASELAWRAGANGYCPNDKKLVEEGMVTFDVIAHSMGGLVARFAIEVLGMDNVNKLFTLGTPHEGVPYTFIPESSGLRGTSGEVQVLLSGSWNGSALPSSAGGVGVGTGSLQIAGQGETEYFFVAGVLSLDALGDGIVGRESAIASNSPALATTETFYDPGPNVVDSEPYYGDYDHFGLHEQIASNGIGARIRTWLSLSGGSSNLDVDRDGDVDLDDYEVVVLVGIFGFDPANTTFTRPDLELSRRRGVTSSQGRAILSRTDLNGDRVRDRKDRLFFEKYAPRGFAALHADRDASVWSLLAAQNINYDNESLDVGTESNGEWRTYLRFAVSSEVQSASSIVAARPMLNWSGSGVASYSYIPIVEFRETTSSWSESGVTWSSQPSSFSTVVSRIDFRPAATGPITMGAWSGDISSLVQKWRTSSNYGVELRMPRPTGASGDYILYVPSRTSFYYRPDGQSAPNYGAIVLVEYQR